MNKLKVSKFGVITKDKDGDLLVSGFSFEGDCSGDIKLDVIDAMIEEFNIARLKVVEELKQEKIKK